MDNEKKQPCLALKLGGKPALTPPRCGPNEQQATRKDHMSGTGDGVHKARTSNDAAAEADILCDQASAENLFRTLSKSSSDAIIGEDLQGRINVWNDAAEELFGYTEQEMLGRDLLCIMPPDDAKLEIGIVGQILLGKTVSRMDTVRLHKNGTQLDVSLTVAPVRNAGGRVVGALKVMRNIAHKVQLEETARRFEALVQSSDDAIIGKNLHGIINTWNAGARAIFGYSEDEIVGRPMQTLIPPERHDEERLFLRRLARGEKIDHFETVRLHKDGRQIDVSVTISPIRDQHGKVIGASKIARDITARKALESRMKLMASVFIHTNDGIAITDRNGVILDINQALTKLSGYQREEVIGKLPQIFQSRSMTPEFALAMRDSLAGTGSYQAEAWGRRKDGEAFTGLLTVDAIKSSNGDIDHYVAVFADITALRDKQLQLEHAAHFDALTDLPNRVLLADRLHQCMTQCQRREQSLAVLYLDLDFFKTLNDKHGHDFGDEVLIAVSHRMRDALREGDTLARIGGDEFVAILIDAGTPLQCAKLAERILHACSAPLTLRGVPVQISASIGVTLYPQDDADADQLVRHADRAMYEAKQAGKNRVNLFDASFETEVTLRGLQLDRIALALQREEFVLFYQPKVNMRTGQVVGAEALVRWQHPERGLVPPGEFLPLIENHPLYHALGRWVLETNLRHMDNWRASDIALSVSVNVGSAQLQDPAFAEELRTLLARYPEVRPASLELEILETSALHDTQSVSEVMRVCRELGVHFSVDDFGTGYSSLTYLRHLPAQTLKIDQSFVRGMLCDREDLAIVKGVIGLAEAFGRIVIAEGVETEEIGVRLLELGCELAQGYGIARPMPADQLLSWAANWRPYNKWQNHQL
jgi:diguanylate cyclase (GGDEF)-like protein/PAS domain S-box-containing protein